MNLNFTHFKTFSEPDSNLTQFFLNLTKVCNMPVFNGLSKFTFGNQSPRRFNIGFSCLTSPAAGAATPFDGVKPLGIGEAVGTGLGG